MSLLYCETSRIERQHLVRGWRWGEGEGMRVGEKGNFVLLFFTSLIHTFIHIIQQTFTTKTLKFNQYIISTVLIHYYSI